MAKKTKGRRGPPRTTGPGTVIGLRCHAPFLKAVDDWREEQHDDKLTRPAAIIRLAEVGLLVLKPSKRTSAKSASRALDMAGDLIDSLGDQSASAEDQAKRKRRLLKGPREFRDILKDNPAKNRK